MRKVLLLVFGLLFLFQGVSFAVDLDKPLTNTSLKSEIHRGFLTHSAFSEKSLAETGYHFHYQVQKVISQNILNGKDSDGFNLGVYFSTWVKISNEIETRIPLYLRYPSSDNYYKDPQNLERVKKLESDMAKENNDLVLMYYNKFRELQTQWDISDQKLCEINDVDYNIVKPWFDKYWAKTHPEQ